MESLKNFANSINEAAVSKAQAEKIHKEQEKIFKKVKKGLPADENGTDGVWEVDPPTDDDLLNPIKKDDPAMLEENKKAIARRLRLGKPFLILGEAGWGKTSVIKQISKRYGYSILTIYLDKCQREDLGGIPAYGKGDDGIPYQELLMPAWAKYILTHSDDKFLLFFDEMNQADPTVMNALMPIVLENQICGRRIPNFVAAAAGNFEWENREGVNEISGPLLDRFGGKAIIWETDWTGAFNHLSKKWGDKISKEVLQLFIDNAEYFRNPRAIENDVFDAIVLEKNSEDPDFNDVNDWVKIISAALKRDDELDNRGKKAINQIAEVVHSFVTSSEETKKIGRSAKRGGKDINMVSDDFKNKIKKAMKQGYMVDNQDPDKIKYGVSRENAPILFCDEEYSEEPMPNEILQRLINKFEADGIKFKYETNDEWKKAGLADPTED